MSYLKSYKELIVWQKAMELAKEVYLLTCLFPKSEIYGITSQMRRAVVSIPSNIAEGYSRKTSREYSQFLSIAYGSTQELYTQTILANDLGFAGKEKFVKTERLTIEVSKMLNKLIDSIKIKIYH